MEARSKLETPRENLVTTLQWIKLTRDGNRTRFTDVHDPKFYGELRVLRCACVSIHQYGDRNHRWLGVERWSAYLGVSAAFNNRKSEKKWDVFVSRVTTWRPFDHLKANVATVRRVWQTDRSFGAKRAISAKRASEWVGGKICNNRGFCSAGTKNNSNCSTSVPRETNFPSKQQRPFVSDFVTRGGWSR